MTIYVDGPENLSGVARQVLDFAGNEKIFLFYGEMGSGKTTLIKAICRELGIGDLVSSPTFSIVNEYASPQGPVYHFDFYRLKNETEALDIGYEDYIYSGCYCFIEWPEKINTFLPEKVCRVNIKVETDNRRKISVQKT